jgi:phasin family protein
MYVLHIYETWVDSEAFDVATENSFSSKGFPIMSTPSVEDVSKANADALTKSGNASIAALQELTKAYQELAVKNAKNVMAAIQALSAVKTPAEFMELQQRLIKESVDAAVRDSQHIAQLTAAVFTAASEPVKKQIDEAVQKTARG